MRSTTSRRSSSTWSTRIRPRSRRPRAAVNLPVQTLGPVRARGRHRHRRQSRRCSARRSPIPLIQDGTGQRPDRDRAEPRRAAPRHATTSRARRCRWRRCATRCRRDPRAARGEGRRRRRRCDGRASSRPARRSRRSPRNAALVADRAAEHAARRAVAGSRSVRSLLRRAGARRRARCRRAACALADGSIVVFAVSKVIAGRSGQGHRRAARWACSSSSRRPAARTMRVRSSRRCASRCRSRWPKTGCDRAIALNQKKPGIAGLFVTIDGGISALTRCPLMPDDVVAGIDVGHFAGDARGQVRAQERGDVADVLDGDAAAQRRVLLRTWPSILRKFAMPEAARVRIGPAEIALTRVPSGPRLSAR